MLSWRAHTSSGHLPTAETPQREAKPPPHRPFRALPEPPPDGRPTVGESALTGQLGRRFAAPQ
eukprot:10943487-Alexandrium_andersonii.AAC.1